MTSTTVELDRSGYPVDGYFDSVVQALAEHGITATADDEHGVPAVHREEPWEWTANLDPRCWGNGAYGRWGNKRLMLCWQATEDEPDWGTGWYLVPCQEPGKPANYVVGFAIGIHARPVDVATAVTEIIR